MNMFPIIARRLRKYLHIAAAACANALGLGAGRMVDPGAPHGGPKRVVENRQISSRDA
jgi:hypothetical protein